MAISFLQGLSETEQQRVTRGRLFGRAAGLGAAVVGTVALVGWLTGVDVLKSVVPGQVTMKANTALCLIGLGSAQAVLCTPSAGRRSRVAARLTAAAVAAFSLVVLSQWLHGHDLGIDQALFQEPAGAVGTAAPGRMAPNTGVVFALLGLTLLWLDRPPRGRLWAAPALALVGGLLALLAIVGYASGVTSLYGVSRLTQMAVPTAVALVALAAGSLFARAEHGPTRLIVSDGAGGAVLRRLLPAATIIPVVLGCLRLAGQSTGLYGTAVGTSLFVTAMVTLLVTFVWRLAATLEVEEAVRRRSEAALEEAQERAAAFDDAPIGMAVVGLDGEFVRVNRALCDMTGYGAQELLRLGMGPITHPDDQAADGDAIERLMRGEARGFQRQKRYRHREGHDVVGLVQVTAILGVDGRPQHFVGQIQDVTARVRAEQQLQETQLQILERLAVAAEYRDDDTGEHTRRVGVLSADIGRAVGLTPEDCRLLRQAAPLHDVGKIGIPDAVLLKPGKLTDEEFARVRSHSAIGAGILAGRGFPLLEMAEKIASTHHERWDGRGYPDGLSGTQIPLVGRIVAVADVFDALTHARPYKQAWSVADAVEEIRSQAGRQFDPLVVDVFLRHVIEAAGRPADAEQPPTTATAA